MNEYNVETLMGMGIETLEKLDDKLYEQWCKVRYAVKLKQMERKE